MVSSNSNLTWYLCLSEAAVILHQAAHPLAELPQFLGRGVVAGFGVQVPHGAVGEVASAQRLQTLLQSAVQRGLTALLRVFKEESRNGSQNCNHHAAHVSVEFRVYGTWVQRVAAHVGALQSLVQLVGEEHVAQFAVGVGLQQLHEGLAGAQSPVLVQTVKVDASKVVGHRRHVDHPTGGVLLQTRQQQIGQEEVAQMIDPKHHPEAVLRAAIGVQACVVDEDVQSWL